MGATGPSKVTGPSSMRCSLSISRARRWAPRSCPGILGAVVRNERDRRALLPLDRGSGSPPPRRRAFAGGADPGLPGPDRGPRRPAPQLPPRGARRGARERSPYGKGAWPRREARAAARHSGRAQGHLRHRRRAHHRRLAHLPRPGAGAQRHGQRAPRGGRRGPARQAHHERARDDRAARVRRGGPQPLEPRVRAGLVEQRLGGWRLPPASARGPAGRIPAAPSVSPPPTTTSWG